MRRLTRHLISVPFLGGLVAGCPSPADSGIGELTDGASSTGKIGSSSGKAEDESQTSVPTSGHEATGSTSPHTGTGMPDPGGMGPLVPANPQCTPGAVGVAADTHDVVDLGLGGSARAESATVGWFDADQWRDLAVAVGSTIRILRGSQGGNVQSFDEGGEGVELSFTDPFDDPPIWAVDLTADGRQELIRWNEVVSTDQQGEAIAVEEVAVVAAYVRDLDGDGLPDLLSSPSRTEVVNVLLSVDLQTLVQEPISTSLDIPADKHTLGDFDGDGLLDFVAIDQDTVGPGVAVPAQVQVYRGVGDGTFVPAMTPLELGLSRYVAAAGDLDCDGRDELLTARPGSELPDEGVTMWQLEGDALMEIGFIEARWADELEVADFNGDGVFDLALRDRVVDLEEFTISVMPGVGDGTFHPRVQLSSNLDNRLLGVADLDGDNRFSVIVGDGPALRLYDVQ